VVDYFAILNLELEDFNLVVGVLGGSETEVLFFVEHKTFTLNAPSKVLLTDFLFQI